MEEQAAPEADRIFFYHLPKCAGTSVWETLRKLFGFENVLQIYDRELADRFAKMTPAEKGAYKAIGGHYPLEFYSSQLDLADYFSITMFRDPVERVISEYQYILYNELHPDHRAVSKLSLADFTALPRYSNLMTKWLCGRADAEAAVSVISETFNRWYFLADIETMIADICLCAGQPSLRVPHANAGAPERSPEIDVELIGLIEKRNLADLALYEILTSEREKRLPPSTTTSRSIRAAPLPAFHIVTPCLNAARYIGETIDSVVGQAGNFFIRYHVQDGGSTDGTIAIVKQWHSR